MEIPTAAKTLLEHKGREVWTIAPDVTVYEAIKTMSEKMSERCQSSKAPNSSA